MRHLTRGMWLGAVLALLAGSSPLFAQQGGKGMMKNMSEAEKLKVAMMMKMEIGPTDSAALLAVGDQLELTEEQTEKLQQILATAREQAEQVLKPDQREKLEGVADLPATHMGMHKTMMKKMKAKMKAKMKGKVKGKSDASGKGDMMDKGTMEQKEGGMMCPMMQAMQSEKSASDRRAKIKKRMQEKKKHGAEGGHRHGAQH